MKRRDRILIVDDDPTNVDILLHLLEGKYEVATAATGNECLAKVADFRPQLVLLDIMMPGINGHEACRRIKLSPLGDSVRIILVSAKETIADRQRGSDVLADDYVIKPFGHAEMLAKVRDQLELEGMQAPSDLTSDCEALEFVGQMSEQQRQRAAAALKRLEQAALANCY